MTFKRPARAGWAILAIGALCAVGFVDAALAQTAAPAADAAAVPAAAVPNKGDTAWMLISSALVLMMSVPGLALFYGGLVRTKNMASILTQVFAIVSMVGVLWTLYGYSLAFTDGGSMSGLRGPSSSRTSVRPRMQRSKPSERRAKSGASCSYSKRLNWLTMK